MYRNLPNFGVMKTEQIDTLQAFIEKYEEPRLHEEAILSAPLFTMEVGIRVLIPLWDSGVRTIGDVLRLYRSGRLCKIHMIGKGQAEKIERFLIMAGLIEEETQETAAQ